MMRADSPTRTRSLSIEPATMRSLFLCALTLLSLACASTPKQRLNVDETMLALEGYDPVSYFVEGGGRPEQGKPEFAASHGGATYHFVVERHRDMFLQTPERYMPAYGGWCAYAIAKTGDKVSVDPRSYVIQQGRLLLFYKSALNDTRAAWIRESAGLLESANAKWFELTEERFEPYAGLDNVDEQGLALEGYDPVSYFGGVPLEGDPQWTFEHAGVTYRFADAANRDTFAAAPETYLPAYGGWCAYGFAMKDGLKFPVDPTSFVIQNGQLMLFLETDEFDARAIWDNDPENLQMLADQNWGRQRGRP